MAFKLINSATRAEIKPGDAVRTFRGQAGTLQSFTPPRHTGSTGRVCLLLEGWNSPTEFYPGVIDAEIIGDADTGPTADQVAALARYAKANGRTWKTKLADAWLDGRDAREPDGCYLRQVRNTFGPSWLKAYRLPE